MPRNARHIEGKFSKLIDKALGDLSLDKKEISMLKFTYTIDGYHTDNDVRKLNSELIFVKKKIDEIVTEQPRYKPSTHRYRPEASDPIDPN